MPGNRDQTSQRYIRVESQSPTRLNATTVYLSTTVGRILITLALLFGSVSCSNNDGIRPAPVYVGIIDCVFGGYSREGVDGSLHVVESMEPYVENGIENVVVASGYKWGVSIFSTDGEILRNWGVADKDNIGSNLLLADVAVTPDGKILATDYRGHRVLVFSPAGELIRSFGEPGTADGQFMYPLGIRVDNNGEIYVVGHQNNRIQVFDQDGTFKRSWGKTGEGSGEFLGAYDIDIGHCGAVYVSDREGKRIQKFDKDGNFILQWDGLGTTGNSLANQFEYIHALAIDSRNRIYVTDLKNNHIQIYTNAGEYLATLLLHSPKGITITSDDYIFVGSWYTHRVYKLRPLSEHLVNKPNCVRPVCDPQFN